MLLVFVLPVRERPAILGTEGYSLKTLGVGVEQYPPLAPSVHSLQNVYMYIYIHVCMHMSGWNELVCTTLALYPHFSSFCTMPVYTHTTTDTPQDTHILIPFEDSGPTGPKVDRGWGILLFKDTLMVEQRLWKQ